MDDTNLKEKVFAVIRKEIGVDCARIDPHKDIREQVNLDSMQFVALVARIELELDIELPISVMTVNTLHEFIACIREKVASLSQTNG